MAESYSVEAFLRVTGADRFINDFRRAAGQIEGVERSSRSAGVTIKKLATSIGLVATAAKGFQMLRDSLDGAIARYDTLSGFPKVLQLMGFSAQDSQKAIDKLSKGIDGLPTTLDSVAKTTQRIATMTGDLDGAVDTTIALNNAFLASGASSADAARGLEQYVQMMAAGKVDMQSWRTLQETMPVALNRTAEAFGFAGRSAQNDLYEALKSGEITFDEFNAKLIELNEGTGGFAELARTSSTGIATSWQNIKTNVVKGLADMIATIDQSLSSFGGISGVLDKIKNKIKTVFNWINDKLPPVISSFVNLFDTVKNSTAFQSLVEVFQNAIDKFNELKTAFLESEAFETVKGYVQDIAEAFLELDFVQITEDIQSFLDKWTPLIAGILGGITAFKTIKAAMTIWQVVSTIGASATMLLGGAFAFLTSPIFLAALAIGAIIAIGVLLWKNWDTIKEKASELGDKISEIWENIKSWTSEKWEAIKTSISNAVNNAKETVVNKFNEIKDAISEKVSNALSTVRQKFEEIKSAISEKLSSSVKTVKQKFQDIVNSIREKMNEVKSRIEEGWNKAKSFLEGIDLRQIGKDIIQGLINGIKSKIEAVKSAVKEVSDSITQKIKSILKIASPSRVMMDIAKWIPIGMAEGIDRNQNYVTKSISRLSNALIEEVPQFDLAGQISNVHRQSRRQMTYDFQNEMTISKQPAYINIMIGGQTFSAFVRDITDEQNFQEARMNRFRG